MIPFALLSAGCALKTKAHATAVASTARIPIGVIDNFLGDVGNVKDRVVAGRAVISGDIFKGGGVEATGGKLVANLAAAC